VGSFVSLYCVSFICYKGNVPRNNILPLTVFLPVRTDIRAYQIVTDPLARGEARLWSRMGGRSRSVEA
ncbi:MAG: hypothetical protein ACREDR_26650, partial [Blastocatellia bacterium]